MALDRYQFTKKLSNDKLNSTRYPMFEKQVTDRYIFSREGDRLDLLATEFYNDPRFWWVLAQANELGKGSLIVPPGKQLRIPFPIDQLLKQLRAIEEEK